jgi:hypothetical protein
LTEEKPSVDCIEQIDDLYVPHMPKFEHVVIVDIVVYILGYSSLVSEPEPKPTFYDQPTQKYMPYHHPHHKSQRNDNHAFRYLQKTHEIHSCGPVSTTRIDYG